MKWQLVPVEPTPEMIDAWNNDDSDEFRHAYHVMLEAAPQPEPLSDDRIDEICDCVERSNVLFSQSGIYALACAIEREILGCGE